MDFLVFLVVAAVVLVVALVLERGRQPRDQYDAPVQEDHRVKFNLDPLPANESPRRQTSSWGLTKKQHAFLSWHTSRDWVVVDTETTGVTGSSEIVEIAILDPDGKVLFQSTVMPQGRIPKAASDVHGLTRAHLKGSPQWPAVHQQVCNLLAGKRVLSYNAEFDSRLLSQTMERHGLTVPRLKWECVMLAFAEYHGEWNDYRDSYKWIKLERAMKIMGLPFRANHRAANDAEAAVGLIHAVGERLTETSSAGRQMAAG